MRFIRDASAPRRRDNASLPRTRGRATLATLLLLVAAPPAVADTLVFRENAAGYTGTQDTFLQQSAPGAGHGNLDRTEWDSDDPPGTGQDNVALLRFDSIFGGGANQIPAGAQITSATLTYDVINEGGVANVYESAVAWSESVTWNGFGASPGVQSADLGAFVGNAAGTIGTRSLDVTTNVAAWSADPSSNHGWLFLPASTDGCEFRSSENATGSLRPTLTVVFNEGGPAPSLVRRPYLQRGTPDDIVIAWRTNVPCDSRVRYGPAPDQLSQEVTSATNVTDHVVTLSGLTSATRYYYDVGTTTLVLAGGDTDHYFDRAPPTGATARFTAWIVGDSGTGGSAQAAVRDAMLAHVGADLPSIYIHVGDMAYSSGTDAEFTNRFFLPYQDILRHTVCWPVIGNHEGHTSDSASQSGPYYQAYVLPSAGEAGGLPSGTEAYYSFDYAGVHFIALDSYETDRSPGSPMLMWLAADLADTAADWIIAFWHHPPYSKGSHDSDTEVELIDMRENVLPILEAAGVDLVLAGHSHIYERSFLVDGAYDTPTTAGGHVVDSGDGRTGGDGAYTKSTGLNAHEGCVYVVAGHGGAGLSQEGVHPLMYFSELEHGSCIMSIEGNALSLRNIRHDGVVSDWFDLIKLGPPGDIDGDGDADATDVALFVDVLLGLDTMSSHVAAADVNQSGASDGDDVQPFVAALAG